jgi:hypothetical protein
MTTCAVQSHRQRQVVTSTFLLLVDDLSSYIWVVAIPSKDRAVAAIKDIQAWAEGESGLKLKALRTDCGGEFSVMEFAY